MPQSRWYPTTQQLKDPSALERSFRQLLEQHYALQDAHDALVAKVNAPVSKPTGPPPGSGPTDTQICGLFVAPIDANSLADGTKLTYVKAQGQFVFK
jgi:hypothetical protein